eukprot:1138498-Pelagomonas_calceolata.AAC.3
MHLVLLGKPLELGNLSLPESKGSKKRAEESKGIAPTEQRERDLHSGLEADACKHRDDTTPSLSYAQVE